MNYQDSLNYIHSLLRFGIKPGLERVSALLRAMGEPQERCRFIHVAGTNGKGSTCAMLAAMLKASGKKTGLYTSPYVSDFRERIQISGEYISKEDLCIYTEKVKSIAQSIGEEPTEFEFITAMAFMYFADTKCDVVVLETGLGGMFDATNVINKPLVSVIVPIDLDHTSVLGNTVGEIAAEKAGIIKTGCPVVSAFGQQPETVSVLEESARRHGCVTVFADKDSVQVGESDLNGTGFFYRNSSYRVRMAGIHQVQNAVTAIETAELLPDYITEQAIHEGLETAFMPARMEIISREPLLVLDGGHNPHAAEVLRQNIAALPQKPTAIIGMMEDKDVEAFACAVGGLFEKIITVRVRGNDRSMNEAALANIFSKYNSNVSSASDYDSALKAAGAGQRAVMVCGSLYLAGDIRPMLFDIISH